MSAVHAERLDLEPLAPSVKNARTFVVRLLRDWGLDDLVEASAVITSELATNVVRHARTRYAVVVVRLPEGVQIDVLDDEQRAPAPRTPGHEEPRGRGLALVASLSRSWGPTPAGARDGFAKGVRAFVS